MTLKEYNALRSRIYNAAMEDPEIADAVKIGGVAYIFEINELPDKHGILVLTAKTQLNENTLHENGFTAAADCRLRLTIHGQRKTVDLG